MALSDLSSNPMNFTENQHGNTILEKLKQQKDQGRFCDVTLYVEGNKYRAHRNVLASCSPYFDSVLKMHKTVKEGLTITCQDPEVFQCILNYMYTGSIVIDKNNVIELLRLANHFLVSKLRDYCAEYLDRYLDATNCLSVREMAEKYNMPSLMKTATAFIQVNLTKVIFEDEILSCSLKKIEDFLSEKSWSVPHDVLLGLIARWVNKDVSVRERSMRALLTFVDWHSLDGSVITEHIDREPLYSTSEVSLYFTLQSLVENNMLFSKYQGVYQALQEKFSQNGSPLDDDSFLNMAVSTAIEGLQEATSSESNSIQPSSERTKDVSDSSDKCCSLSEASIPVKTLARPRRYKQKLFRMRPGARLAAIKAALAARRKRLNKNLSMSAESHRIKGCVPCHLCSHSANSVSLLEQHLALAHAKDVTYKCGLCGFMCQWNKEYFSHMKEHFQGPPFSCDSCKFSCEQINVLLSHRLNHSGERLYNCDECGYRCSTHAEVLVHKQCHSSSTQSFKCDVCGKLFAFKAAFEQHLLSHGNDRPYVCDTCGFSTKYLSHLIAHKRIHASNTGDVFRCSYPQCKYSTSKKSQLGSHARAHTGVRPHSCSICGRGFLEKSHLVRHERIHLEEKPFKCSQCEYASSRRDKLKEHFGRHHGENASAKVPYKARPVRGLTNRTNPKNCQDSGSAGGGAFNSSSSSSNSSSGSLERNSTQPVAGNGDLDLMMQHHISASAANAPPQQPSAYPAFSDSHHSSLEFHHHQLLNSRTVSKSDHHSVHHHQTPTHHHMLPPSRSQHHQSSAAAVAAMMLDPRFHHANPGGSYPAAGPPVSMATMVAQGGPNQSQGISGIAGQHHQGDYPCMPLF